jgi:hypothetical protein
LSDSLRGRQFALEYLHWEQRQKQPHHNLLAKIVANMPRKLGHAEISFLTMVAEAAIHGFDRAEALNAHYDKALKTA